MSIAAFALMTHDKARLARFYAEALGFAVEADVLRLGRQTVRLVQAPSGARPMPTDSTSTDLWFQHLAIVTTDIAAAFRQASAAGAVPISMDGPQMLPERSGGVTAWKFCDPEGHPLELLQFPSGHLPERWRDGRALTLGIDHSAISVSDADASIAWYEAQLGFRLGARQHNWGAEQGRLDGIAVPCAAVVTLIPPGAETPHLELLGYHPPGRRSEAGREDIAATRTILAGDAGRGVEMVADPDGHRIEWIGA